MKKTANIILRLQLKLFCFFLIFSFSSCGTLSSYNISSNDGIYSSDNKILNNQASNNQNGLYYKNYFDQKAIDMGIPNIDNDSIITDIDLYSDTQIKYQNSFGSWGDNPNSVNILYNNYYPRYGFYWDNFYRPYYMNSWYDPFYNPYYSPYYSWNYYYPYGRFGYINFMYRPWLYSRNYGYPPYYGGFYDPSTVAYMSGRRGSSNHSYALSSNKSSSNSTIVNNNVGRNSQTSNNTQSEARNRRNINRLYYTLNGNGMRSYTQFRNYNNSGDQEIERGQSSRSSSNQTSPPKVNSKGTSNFQMSRYGNSSRTNNYNNSRNFGNPSGRSYTTPTRSNNSTIYRSTHSSPSGSIGRSSIRSSSSSGSSSSSISRSRSPR